MKQLDGRIEVGRAKMLVPAPCSPIPLTAPGLHCLSLVPTRPCLGLYASRQLYIAASVCHAHAFVVQRTLAGHCARWSSYSLVGDLALHDVHCPPCLPSVLSTVWRARIGCCAHCLELVPFVPAVCCAQAIRCP